MRCPLTNKKQIGKAIGEEALGPRGSGSSSLARMRFFVSLCALPLISLLALWMTAPACAATWPVSASALSATLSFHQSYSAGNESYVHSGIDIPASAGMQISSPLAGTVRFTGTVPSGDSKVAPASASQRTMKAVSVETAGGKVITLMPFDTICVREGQVVSEGARLGSLASTGDVSSSKTHLHMGYKDGAQYLDPMLLFGVSPLADAAAAQESDAAIAQGAISALQGLAVESAGATVYGQAPEASAAVLGDSLAPDVASQGFGSIESGAFSYEPKAASPGSPFNPLVEGMACLWSACVDQALSLWEGMGAISRATAIPLPVIAGAFIFLGLCAVALLCVVVIRLIVPRLRSALRPAKRFLVFE